MLKPVKRARKTKLDKKNKEQIDASMMKIYSGPTVLAQTGGVTIVAKGSFDFESVV
ncbi:hypothetical protein [Paenibacillus rigui]|uniref:hypothetical protein n=1 Tax=Paenibacillus rigui TaxID=554312 RepID=UPI0015C69078|nr:hypothetical protein [Paenibacillus rigui]